MRQAITGIILSGGLGQRAEGADKGLLPWGGRTRIEALLDDFGPQVDHLLISCNRNLERYAKLAPVVSDELPGYQGPLAGIAAALAQSKTEYAVVVPCDCPHPPQDLVARLLGELREPALDLVYAHDGIRPQYLFCALRKRCAAPLRAYLDRGERSVQGWQRQMNCRTVDFSDCPENFANYNQA